jgi:DNA-binding CsgD family transcriptional regulator
VKKHRPYKGPELDTRRGRLVRSDQVQRAAQRHRILSLRATGMTDEQIAAELGLSARSVAQTIKRQLKKWAEDDRNNTELVRAQLMFELDQLKRTLYKDAITGDTRKLREVLRIIGMQAELSGAHAPQRHEHTGQLGVGIGPAPQLDHGEVERMERAWLHGQGQVIDGTLALPSGEREAE